MTNEGAETIHTQYYKFNLINIFIYLYRLLIKKAFKVFYKVIIILNANCNLLKSFLKLIDGVIIEYRMFGIEALERLFGCIDYIKQSV